MLEHLFLTAGYKITRADMAAAFDRAYPMGHQQTRKKYISSIDAKLNKKKNWVEDEHRKFVWRRTNLREVLPSLADSLQLHREYRQQSDGTWWHHSKNPEFEPHPEFTESDHAGEWLTVEEHASLQIERIEQATPENKHE